MSCLLNSDQIPGFEHNIAHLEIKHARIFVWWIKSTDMFTYRNIKSIVWLTHLKIAFTSSYSNLAPSLKLYTEWCMPNRNPHLVRQNIKKITIKVQRIASQCWTIHLQESVPLSIYVCVCVEVLRPSQPIGVMSSAVSLPNHTFTG